MRSKPAAHFDTCQGPNTLTRTLTLTNSSENFADGAGSDGAGSDGAESDGTESDGGDWRAEQAVIIAELLTLEGEDEEAPIEEAVKVPHHCSLGSH